MGLTRTARAIDVASALAWRHVQQERCRHCFCELGMAVLVRCCRCGFLHDRPTTGVHQARSRDPIGRWLP